MKLIYIKQSKNNILGRIFVLTLTQLNFLLVFWHHHLYFKNVPLVNNSYIFDLAGFLLDKIVWATAFVSENEFHFKIQQFIIFTNFH
jgi:hypothetical protein